MGNEAINLLMVFPSGGDLYFQNFKHTLGAAYIVGYLRKNGFNVEQFISNDYYNVKECVREILKYRPKIIGFTVYEANFMQCALISKGLKSENPNIIIIFGGPTPSVQSEEILETIDSVDLCVRREGEETTLELLNLFSSNGFELDPDLLYNIKGITFRNGTEITSNPDRGVLFANRHIDNYLDKYPSPYLSNIIPAKEAFPIGIITARGCNQNCVFCNCAETYKRNIYYHSIDRVIQELIHISEYKNFLGPIPINDDTFTMIPNRTKQICERIIEENIKVPLLSVTRCDKINEELLDVMKQAGFVAIGFSLESAVPRILKAIGKVSPPKVTTSEKHEKESEFIGKLKRMTTYAKKIGYTKVFVSIMVGLPGETVQNAQKTIDLVKQLDIDFYTHNVLRIFKGTPLFKNPKKYGYDIKSLGRKNKIFITNDYPFDVYKVKVAPNCAIIEQREIKDYDTLRLLSLNPKRAENKPFFNNLIINSDKIKPSLVEWLQDNLSINGAIIQLYSDRKSLLNLHNKNESTLYNEFSPTKYYEPYFSENIDGNALIKSGRMAFYDDEIGRILKKRDTKSTLDDYIQNNANTDYTLCMDTNVSDSKSLYDLILDISKYDNKFEYLLNSKPLPSFQHLCRWTKNHANCQKLETVIVGSDDSIRMCWYSDSLGKVGISFANLIQNLQTEFDKVTEERSCKTCIRNETCIKCLYPYPLSSKDYCQYKKEFDTIESARMISSFEVLKDFLYKPLNLLEF